ncbi:GNAT family N-acetyltransferase [Azospirillum sp. ST 5-10]|uniref:GNAT family N-acetyltransferase n=1 Tax=unclassified Azospirillum TaxID=2630922 RepID=UPI003F49C6E9
MPDLPDTLGTARLLLRPFRAGDMAAVVPLIGDWEVARWLARVPHPYTAGDAAAWVALCAANRAAGRSLDLLAVRRTDGVPVGGAGLALDSGELGYWVGRPFQGNRFAGEMVGALLGWAFAVAGLPRVWACTHPDNGPSQRLLRRLGFADGGLRDHDFALRGGRRPGLHHDLSADRWRALPGDAPP